MIKAILDPSREREVVRRATAGDPQAFAELYGAYLDPIYRYVYYRTGGAQDAEDVTETVFTNAWRAIGRYRQNGVPFRAWLYRIASNAVADFHRARRPLEPLEEALHAGRADLEADLEATEDARELGRGLRKLPEESQQVLLLRFVEGFSHAEVADVLGKSEGACRVLQHRALSALRKHLNGRI